MQELERWILSVVCCVAVGCAPARAQGNKVVAPAISPVAEEQSLSDTQADLIKLLRVSPMLTEVIERDPSLLNDVAYVSRTNPELERYLTAHPEIGRNPEYYLFSGFGGRGQQRREALSRRVWPEYSSAPVEDPQVRMIGQFVAPLLVFLTVLGAVLWLIQVFISNRRWQRVFQAQIAAREKMIDRLNTSEQLMQYMESGGKSLLEMPPVAENDERMPNMVSRVFTSLQIGVVLALLGIGMLILRRIIGPNGIGFMVIGIVFLMPGIGFLLSAGMSWALAGRLGLLPKAPGEALERNP